MALHGYRFGMRQLASQFKLVFQLQEDIDLRFLDRWILEALEFDVASYRPQFVGDRPTGHLAEKYVIRWLCVAAILLQDIRVPVFERAVIAGLKKEGPSGNFAAHVWFPIVEQLPLQVFHAWLSLANELISNVMGHSGDSSGLERIYQEFQEKHVMPWSARIPGAKSTIPVLQAAFECGVPFSHLGSGRYVLGWGARSRIFDRSSNMLDSAIGSRVTQQKHVALQWMRSAGMPVPTGMVFKSGHPLTLSTLAHLRMPLVVKPVDRDRGEGVTLGVQTEAALQSAVEKAARLSVQFLVEEQVEGTCHRILVVDGKVIYAVKRNPKAVVGDGRRSIAALVDHLNAQIRKKIPRKRLPEYLLDELAIDCLHAAGLTPESVLGAGQKAFLRPAQSTQWGGDPEDVTTSLHPDNAALAVRASRLFGLHCAGVDFISTDIARPWHQNGAVINEVNYSPVMGRTHPFQQKAARIYMESLFPHQGKIPIDVFIGDDSRQAAMDLWRQRIEAGEKYVFCSEDGLFGADRSALHLAGSAPVYEKIAMIRTDSSVDGLVVHARSRDVLAPHGQPFEYASVQGGSKG